MKIKLLVAFMVLALVSCSKDDDSGSNNNSGNGEKKLNKIIQTDFNEDGSVKETSQMQFDDNDRLLTDLRYDGDGVLASKREFTYNTSGQLETMAFYTTTTGTDVLDSDYTITYDADGRVTGINDSFMENGSKVTSIIKYVYISNTVIMSRSFSSGGTYGATYTLNTEGEVYKKTDSEDVTEQIIYAGKNISSYSNNDFTSVYTYDNQRVPKGQQHNVVVNQYNGNMENTLILGGFTSIALGNTRYPIQRIDNNGDIYDYKYQFDDDNYPVKLKCIKNGNSLPFSIREIYYK